MVKKFFISIIAITALTLGLQAQAQQQPAQGGKQWKDRAEYDLYTEITKPDATPAARLQNLEKWKSAYPQSEYADVRLKIYLVTYQQMNNHRAAFDTAQEILKTEPNDLQALTEIVGYGLTLVPAQPNATLSAQNKADLDTVEKTARYILGNLDTIYAADKKPANTNEAQWNAAKPTMQKFAQFTIARVAVLEKDTDKAETELKKTLQIDPTNAQASYMLATNLLGQQKEHPDKMPAALFEYARAATYDGPNALPAATRTQVDAFLTKAYNTYHGSAEGLPELKAAAKTAALPSGDFKVKSTVDIAQEKEKAEQELAQQNPSLGFWHQIKEGLTGDQSDTYWMAMKDTALPGSQVPGGKFKATLISATPETRPKELRLGLEKPDVADVILKLDEPLPGKMDPGGQISFSGVAKEFAKEPFTVTFQVADPKEDIEGWTGKGAAPARPATKKGTATKKKE